MSHAAITRGTPYWITLERERLTIDDGGPGFSPGPATERGHSARHSTGLGLDIARQAAEAAGGELHIRPRQPHGSRVEIVLSNPADDGATARPRRAERARRR